MEYKHMVDNHKRNVSDFFSFYGTPRTYISLFSSAGVGCFGFKQNGFKCIATNELLKDRLDIQRANRKCVFEEGYICGDITKDEVKKRLLNEVDVWKSLGNIKDVDVVFATPPCQGMSTANYKKTENEQARNSLVVEAIKLIMEIHPKIFVFENVRAFMRTICTDIDGTDKTISESIEQHLGKQYHIYHKVINFMDYGVPSSRPRTIVIGTLKTLKNISPLNLFPVRKPPVTLRDAIGNLPRLGYGQRDERDVYHFARKYPGYQERWIENLKEGESAFFQEDHSRRPYKIDKDGKAVSLKGSYMGNKYRRLFWDKPGACVATRNDQLASQDTIHPSDNRVLSIRELMRIMTIPSEFVWHEDEKRLIPREFELFLTSNELNIRRCIGEAVPTSIIGEIADNIKRMLDFQDFVDNFKEDNIDNYYKDEPSTNFYINTFLQEQRILNAKETGSFYTPQCVVFDALKSVKVNKDEVRVLEPSVGLGAFLPQVCSLFSEASKIIIDAVEIDATILEALKAALQDIRLGSNVKITFHNSDYLTFNEPCHYDLIAANPPYGKATTKYTNIIKTKHKIRNLFALFMIKFLGKADNIACVIPKNFCIADEFFSIRKQYEGYSLVRLCDFGVKFFKKVFVEIASFHFSNGNIDETYVVDYVNDLTYVHPIGYVYHDKLWLIYRDAWFDEYLKSLKLDVFDFYRDRQLTNSKISNSGQIRVLRSKNILDDGSVISIPGYDKYISDCTKLGIGRFLNSDAIIMPNFTYNTRATILPKETVPNGSIAILLPKEDLPGIDLRFYASEDFRRYYAIVKSKSKFTLNIDNSSIYYIGIKK